jgi:hypothetical protein
MHSSPYPFSTPESPKHYMRNTQPQFLLHNKIIVDGVSLTHISDIGQIQELTLHGLAPKARLADMG